MREKGLRLSGMLLNRSGSIKMREKVAKALRHYAMERYNYLTEEEKKGLSWRRVYQVLKREYKEERRRRRHD